MAVVGGGISAVQLLEEISRVATTCWYTRREPVFRDREFQPETVGRETIAKVMADVAAGRPTGSVVSYTGLVWTPYALAAKERGALERRPMFTAIEPMGVREADGSFTPVDTILWATGFKADLAHLDPLGLRNELGGIALDRHPGGRRAAGAPHRLRPVPVDGRGQPRRPRGGGGGGAAAPRDRGVAAHGNQDVWCATCAVPRSMSIVA